MNDDFGVFVNRLQRQIFDDTRQAFGEAGFNRWQNPSYQGRLENPHAQAKVTGRCGDSMEIFLVFEDRRVKKASYVTDGCGSSRVCGSFAAEMALGKTADELTDITGEAILKKIGRFPKEEEHCAYLAAETLQEALSNYMMDQIENRS